MTQFSGGGGMLALDDLSLPVIFPLNAIGKGMSRNTSLLLLM